MYKNIFLPLALLLLSGCAERGYKLTSNLKTRTAIVENTVDIDTKNKETTQKFEKMKNAVKKELKNQNNKKIEISKPKTIRFTVETLKPKFTEEQLLSSSTEDLIFKRIKQTYQKFGNSEIHGHVIYLNTSGSETKLNNNKIYLLPVSSELNNWYNNFYLKNKRQINHDTTVEYLSKTYLNISKNFTFYGIKAGDYFVIIVSDDPNKDKMKNKVYIAKKIKVEKRKKIMAVFSKKL